MPTSKTAARKPAKAAKAAKPAKTPVRMTLKDVMTALEKAGTAQARKTYARHGAKEPMFGVSFATIGGLQKKIRVDHDLALQLWDTGNYDARNLAYKIADPAKMTPTDLDRFVRDTSARMGYGYVAMLAQEGGNGFPTAKRWLASEEGFLRVAAWQVIGQLAARDEGTPDDWFAARLAEAEGTIHDASNEEKDAMNRAVIAIGGRSPALKKAALAAAKRIGKVDVDHGDTYCETPDAAPYIEKMWAHSKAKGFESPSAQERNREAPRTRC